MKKVLIIIGTAVLTLLIYSACSKQVEEISPSIDLEEISKIGEIHNQAIDYLAQEIDVNTASKEMYFNTIKEYLIKNASTDDERKVINAMNLNTCGCDKKYTSIESWIEENNPTVFEEMYLLKYSKLLNKSDDVGVIWKEIEKVELEIFNETESNLDKARLLGFSSILKHSFKYWSNVRADETHAFHLKMMSNQLDKAWIPIDIYALIDALSYYDCLGNGGFSDRDHAISTCTGQATYSSVRAFD